MNVDVIVIGAGLAGSVSAHTLTKAGYTVALVDARADCAPEFRAEKMGEAQIAQFARLGLAETVLANVTRHESVRIARFGRVVDTGRETEYGFHYADLVNALRGALPARVTSLVGRVEDIATGPQRQCVTLADGRTIEGRLLILATGLGDAVRKKAGIERTMLSRAHSLVFGFSLAKPARDFDFDALVCFGKGRRDRVSYIGLFRIGEEMRANLFVYRTLQDEWTKAFRAAPSETLMRLMPELEAFCGRLDIAGDVAIRSIDLTAASGYQRDGVVLVGDAFRTVCPIIGMGIPKVLTDVERLCTHHLPRWFDTPGMGAEKLAGFYDDRAKRDCDTSGHALSLYARSIATDPGPIWAARRLRNTTVRGCLYGLKRARRRLVETLRPPARPERAPVRV